MGQKKKKEPPKPAAPPPAAAALFLSPPKKDPKKDDGSVSSKGSKGSKGRKASVMANPVDIKEEKEKEIAIEEDDKSISQPSITEEVSDVQKRAEGLETSIVSTLTAGQ